MRAEYRWVVPYAGTLALIGAAFWVHRAISGLMGGQLPVWITFYPSVMLVALMGGFRLGLLATVTAALSVYFFLFVPEGFVFKGLINTVNLAVFMGMDVRSIGSPRTRWYGRFSPAGHFY